MIISIWSEDRMGWQYTVTRGVSGTEATQNWAICFLGNPTGNFTFKVAVLKVFINTRNLSTFSVNIRLNKNTYTSFLMYGATSQNNGFMYIVFINAASEKRTVNFIKIADFVANRTFSGTYSDDTSTLTINASETIWGGIKLLMFKEENY
jgi:hypothetical protein